jgi:hypothetical protein
LSCKAQIFFPEFNIRLYDKYSESDYIFFFSSNTCLEWITNWQYPELRSYFTLKSLLHSGLKQVMSLFTLRSARAILVVALVYSFPDVFNLGTGVQLKLRKHPNAYIAIKWNLNLLAITVLTTLTPLAGVVLREIDLHHSVHEIGLHHSVHEIDLHHSVHEIDLHHSVHEIDLHHSVQWTEWWRSISWTEWWRSISWTEWWRSISWTEWCSAWNEVCSWNCENWH